VIENMKRAYFAAIILWCPGFLYAQGIADGFGFLKIGMGAKASAMGEAYVSIADDGSCAYWNPAGLSKINRLTLYGMHSEWFLGAKLEYFSTVLPCGPTGSIAVYGVHLGSGSIEGRDAEGRPIGDYQNSDLTAGLAYGWHGNRYLCFGFATKFVMQQIFDKTSTGWGLDGGIICRTPSGVNLGIVVQNIGEAYDYNNADINLPEIARLGISYCGGSKYWEIIPAVDIVVDHGLKENIGLSVMIGKTIAVRGGYRIGLTQTYFALGMGIKHSVSNFHLSIDYAFISYSDLGNNQRMSLGIEL
jgi:hypothetical protein